MKTIYIQDNDFTFEMELCMDVWLNGCMKNDPKISSKGIYIITYGFSTYNHPVIHSYLAKAKVIKINR